MATIERLSFWLRAIIAKLTKRLAYSLYFTGTSMRSSSSGRSSEGSSRSLSTVFLEAHSVMMDDMTHVKRIMMTMPLSIASSTSGLPLSVVMFMPTMTMAMAPAAWAEVRPNIMCPDNVGKRKKNAAT